VSAVLVELRGATVRYGREPAVRTGLDLTLRRGERVAVVLLVGMAADWLGFTPAERWLRRRRGEEGR